VIGTRVVEVTSTGKVAGTVATRELKADAQALIDGEINILNVDGTVTTLTTGQDGEPPRYRAGE
jgi:cytoskeletal protein CcmA (bactofilin family)